MHPVHHVKWFTGLNSQLPCILGWPLVRFLPVEHKQDYGVSFLGWNSRSRSPSFPRAGNKEGQGCRWFSSVQFSSVAQSCPTLCDPMNRSTPGLPVHHQLQESTQTHVHQVGDAIQPSHPLSDPSPPAPNPSQHQGLFQ